MPNISKVKSLLPTNKITTRGGSKRQTPSGPTPQENSLSLRPIITPSPRGPIYAEGVYQQRGGNNSDDQGHGSDSVWPNVA